MKGNAEITVNLFQKLTRTYLQRTHFFKSYFLLWVSVISYVISANLLSVNTINTTVIANVIFNLPMVAIINVVAVPSGVLYGFLNSKDFDQVRTTAADKRNLFTAIILYGLCFIAVPVTVVFSGSVLSTLVTHAQLNITFIQVGLLVIGFVCAGTVYANLGLITALLIKKPGLVWISGGLPFIVNWFYIVSTSLSFKYGINFRLKSEAIAYIYALTANKAYLQPWFLFSTSDEMPHFVERLLQESFIKPNLIISLGTMVILMFVVSWRMSRRG